MAQITHTVEFSSENIIFTDERADDGHTYTKVSLFDLSKTDEVGKPSLPIKFVRLIIPAGQTVDNITL